MDFLSPLLGWSLAAGGVVAAAAAVAWFFPPFRKYAIAAGLVALGLIGVYRKGYKDSSARESKRKEEAVRKARKDYDEIDARPDDADSVSKRLRDGNF
jgi:hypothetical protein